MKRFYLDHNATTSLNSDFVQDLAKGQIPWANPASAHSSGKSALKFINKTKIQLFEFFNLNTNEFNIIFHSGATEAANTFLRSKKLLIYFGSDHACAREVATAIESYQFPIDENGHFNKEELVGFISNHSVGSNNILLHYNYVNSETGVVWDLQTASDIKAQTGCSVYVDATQSIGKTQNFRELDSTLDIYTYSGHKFGALKGIGFSFVKKDFTFLPFILGGGQQNNLRSGTLNVQGIASVSYALDQAIIDMPNMVQVLELKHSIIEILSQYNNIQTIPNESINTICFIHKKIKADALLIHFDLAGLDVSSGSACSAGSVEPSKTLLAMGLKDYAKSSIRLSLAKDNLNDSAQILVRIREVLTKIS